VDEVQETGIPWLTDPQRDFLAHLSVLTIQPQLAESWSYDRASDALGAIAEDGEITLRADHENVYVLICGRVIVHCERDWLEWMTPRWAASRSN
jgi:hypothetical protein